MKKLNYELKELCVGNRDGSYATQSDRKKMLQLIANQLPKLGFTHMQANSLKPKHIDALVDFWLSEGLAVGTIKQRMTTVRWWAKKIGKPRIVAKSNAHYGIGPRQYVTNTSKARILDIDKLNKITDQHVRLSLQLQKEFGLRREESIKIVLAYADQRDHLRLKATWTKGGKARVIPIRTDRQRALLDDIREQVGNGGLIPASRNYIQQLYVYENQTRHAGLHKMHGLRHSYAQRRYQEITGWACPVCGGVRMRELLANQRPIDQRARLIISRELGHERMEIVAQYIGS